MMSKEKSFLCTSLLYVFIYSQFVLKINGKELGLNIQLIVIFLKSYETLTKQIYTDNNIMIKMIKEIIEYPIMIIRKTQKIFGSSAKEQC